MDDPRAGVPTTSPSRWTRSAVGRDARRLEWRALGAAHRRTMARPALAISTIPDVSSTISTVATHGRARASAPRPRRGSARPRQTRSVGSLHRRQLQLGEKRGSAVGPTRRGKGSKIMAISDRHGLPLAIHVASASPHEVTLVDATLAASFLDTLPTRLIGDRGYDSDRLDAHLRTTYGIEMIARHRPHRRTRTQDGRPLRRTRRRWKIERLFAWLHNYRRIVTRWERYPANFLGMIHLASAVILLRHL
jgi:transposase